jgi:hypothetical protein
MPRDGSGNYTLPALGNPAVTNTPITIAWWNGTSTDMASAFTDSLSRSGLGGMLVPFTLVDGTVGAPAFAFQNEPNTGIYRAGAQDVRLAVGGADVWKWTATATTGAQPLSLSKGLTVVGAPNTTGVTSTGGAGTAHGVVANATGLGNGITATGGTSTAAGVAGLAGTSAGYGVYALGTGGGLGLIALSSSTAVDVLRADGYVDVSHATNPPTTTAFTNRLTPNNIIKAWAHVFVNGADAVTVSDAFNITSITYSNSPFRLTVTMASAMAGTNYGALGIGDSTSPAIGTLSVTSSTIFALVCNSSLRGGGMTILVLGAQ